jgi:hypothetical protein
MLSGDMSVREAEKKAQAANAADEGTAQTAKNKPAKKQRPPEVDAMVEKFIHKLGTMTFCQRSLHMSCRMGRHIVMMKLICLLDHFECDSHTVHKLSQRRLIAD